MTARTAGLLGPDGLPWTRTPVLDCRPCPELTGRAAFCYACVAAHRPPITTACWWCGAEATEKDFFGTPHCGNPLCAPLHGGRRLGRLHVATLKFREPSIMIAMLKKKEGRRPHYLHVLGRMAAGYMREHLAEMAEYTLVLPAPTHPDTVAERGYEITAAVHRTCAELVGPSLPKSVVFDDLDPPVWDQVKRVGARGKTWKERQAAVKGAYRVRDDCRTYIAKHGRRVLIIDDVYTTGQDLEEMAGELLSAGATKVDALAVIRALHDAGGESDHP
jgi:predicted amidophosphoribosyltransferase